MRSGPLSADRRLGGPSRRPQPTASRTVSDSTSAAPSPGVPSPARLMRYAWRASSPCWLILVRTGCSVPACTCSSRLLHLHAAQHLGVQQVHLIVVGSRGTPDVAKRARRHPRVGIHGIAADVRRENHVRQRAEVARRIDWLIRLTL